MNEYIWVLCISNDYGISMHASPNEGTLRGILHDYVERWWSIEFPNKEMSVYRDEAIEDYFEWNGSEFYDLDKIKIV